MEHAKKVKTFSNRSLGLVFFVVFFIISLPSTKSEGDLKWWALALALVFLILGILNSKLLNPLNKIWFKFGLLLGSIVSPIVMGSVYFIVVTPMGIFTRLMGKDLLKMGRLKNASTYWVKRDKQGGTMRKQF